MITRERIFRGSVIFFILLFSLVPLRSAFAAPLAQQVKVGLFGVVESVSKDTVTIKKGAETVIVKFDAKSIATIPAVATPTVAAIPVGSRVALLAERRADGLYAVKINVIPAEPKDKHVTLTIVEVSGKTVIGEKSTGEFIVVELDFDLPGELKGQLITFIGEQPESNRFKAKAAMKLENVVARLDKHVKEKKSEADREREPQVKARKQKDVEELKARLEANTKEHLDRFAEVIAKAPEQARPGLERALENFKREAATALGSTDKSPQEVRNLLEHSTLKGIVESVNVVAGEVAIQSRGNAVVKVKATAATQIRLGKAQSAIGNIRAGDPVEVRFNRQTGEAATIIVTLGVEAEGQIKSIDATAKTLTLAMAGNSTLSLKLLDATKIELNDKPVTLANLAVGMLVKVEYNSRTLEATAIKGKLKSELELIVDRVDGQARTIVGHTDDGKSVTARVTDATRIEVKGSLSSIFGLQAGARIKIEINTADGAALKIKLVDKERESEEAKAQGVVVRIDHTAKKLTVRLPNKSEITVTVADATKIEVDGENEKLADLKEGDAVKLEYDPQTMVALELEKRNKDKERPRQEPKGKERQKLEGTITAIDTAKGTLTIFTKNGESKIITVKADTAMAFNEKRISALSDLPPAAAVKVEYTEGNVAIKIESSKKSAQAEKADKKKSEEKGGRP